MNKLFKNAKKPSWFSFSKNLIFPLGTMPIFIFSLSDPPPHFCICLLSISLILPLSSFFFHILHIYHPLLFPFLFCSQSPPLYYSPPLLARFLPFSLKFSPFIFPDTFPFLSHSLPAYFPRYLSSFTFHIPYLYLCPLSFFLFFLAPSPSISFFPFRLYFLSLSFPVIVLPYFFTVPPLIFPHISSLPL
jgi:hypothetical protein